MCGVVLLFPSSHLIHPFPRQSAPLIPNFSVVLRQVLSVAFNNNNNDNNNEGDDDDRPAKRYQREKYSGAPGKRLRCLYALQSTPFGRLLALES